MHDAPFLELSPRVGSEGIESYLVKFLMDLTGLLIPHKMTPYMEAQRTTELSLRDVSL